MPLEDYKVSVIVPVYNAEKYLKRCMDSLLAQTHKNIEILLVDDGSKDSSGKMCDEYDRNYLSVKTFHKENGGSSSARNAGIRMATGDYVAFCDSDDEKYGHLHKNLKWARTGTIGKGSLCCDFRIIDVSRCPNYKD